MVILPDLVRFGIRISSRTVYISTFGMNKVWGSVLQINATKIGFMTGKSRIAIINLHKFNSLFVFQPGLFRIRFRTLFEETVQVILLLQSCSLYHGFQHILFSSIGNWSQRPNVKVKVGRIEV